MEILSKNTLQDTIEAEIILRRLSGILERHNRRGRILYCGFLVLGVILFVWDLRLKLLFSTVPSVALVIASLVNIIFADRINRYYYKRSIKRNYKIVSKKYNYDFCEPTTVKIIIENDFVEVETLDQITKFYIKDYVRYFKEGRFYIFEFTNGKYIFIDIEDVSDDMLKEICSKLENK